MTSTDLSGLSLDKPRISMLESVMDQAKNELQRVVIIGNSGSGKTHLARQLAEMFNSKVIHFDKHFWEPGGFTKKRPIESVHSEIRQLSTESQWIMEGVFGDLAAIALERATALIFLNMDWNECKQALINRGAESAKQKDPLEAQKSFQELLIWAEAYPQRENSRSLKGHTKLFLDFTGLKQEFQNRQSLQVFLQNL